MGVYREDTGVVWSPGEMLWSVGRKLGERGREGRTLGLVAMQEKEEDSGVRAVLLTHEVSKAMVFLHHSCCMEMYK